MKKGFVLGLAIGLTIAGASLVLANSQIQAILNDQIKVTLNGEVQEFKDETTNETQYPITYHDRTYLPLRNVAQLSGLSVDYDNKTNTAVLKKKESESYVTKYTNANWDGISIADMGNNMISVEYYSVSSAPYNRIAGFKVYNVKIAENGEGGFIFEDDGWGHAGSGIIMLKNDKLELEIYDVHDNGTGIAETANWTVPDGHHVFNKVNDNITVEEAINYTDAYYHLFKVRLPKVTGNTNTIKELNQKILNEELPGTYGYIVMHAEDPEALNKGLTYDYKSIIKNNILVIDIYSSIPEGGSGAPCSGGGLGDFSYYYDIENDKILTVSEAAIKLSLSLNGLTTREGASLNSYDELESNFYTIIISDGELEFRMLD